MKAKEIITMSVDEIEASLADSRKQLFQLVNRAKREKKIEKPHQIRLMRRQIARLLTVLRQKEIAKAG